MSASKSSVRRCLFGVPDHEALRKDLDAQLKQTNTEMSQTWNYDFDLDKPQSGRFEWSLPDLNEYVPEFYKKGYRRTRFVRRRALLEPENIGAKSDITPPSSPSSLATAARLCAGSSAESESDIEAEARDLQRVNETTPESRPRSERQTKIDEFMKVKKRRLADEDITDDRPSKRR